jgi:alpha/beta superfamily hydrolase
MVAHHQGRRHQAAVKAVAARLGFAFDRTMILVKAGGAWAHDKHEMISFITPFVTIRADETRYGWMFGTGVEHAFFGNWSAKVEYDYLDLGTRSLHFPGLAGLVIGLHENVEIRQHMPRGPVLSFLSKALEASGSEAARLHRTVERRGGGANAQEMPMTPSTIRITFAGSLGDELAARLDLPAGAVRAYALFAHCFTCSKDIIAARQIAAKLAALGIAVLRFDFTGLGSSQGEFANTTFSSNIEDLVRAADHLRTRFAAPALLIGHSLGGAAVLAAAHRVPEATAVVTIAAPSDVAHVLQKFGAELAQIERDGVADVTLAGRSFPIRKDFVEDAKGRAPHAVGCP